MESYRTQTELVLHLWRSLLIRLFATFCKWKVTEGLFSNIAVRSLWLHLFDTMLCCLVAKPFWNVTVWIVSTFLLNFPTEPLCEGLQVHASHFLVYFKQLLCKTIFCELTVEPVSETNTKLEPSRIEILLIMLCYSFFMITEFWSSLLGW